MVTRNEITATWNRYGVAIMKYSEGDWRWAEVDESDEICGPVSMSFSTFVACVADLEYIFGLPKNNEVGIEACSEAASVQTSCLDDEPVDFETFEKVAAALRSARLMLRAWKGQRANFGLDDHPELDSTISECDKAVQIARGHEDRVLAARRQRKEQENHDG